MGAELFHRFVLLCETDESNDFDIICAVRLCTVVLCGAILQCSIINGVCILLPLAVVAMFHSQPLLCTK